MVSFIIVNYKSIQYSEKCIDSIYNTIKSVPFEIIIVNNSPEENLQALQSKGKNILIIQNTNTGFSSGCNLGAKYARGDYFLFLNPDIILLNDFFPELFGYFKNKDFGAIGLKLFNLENEFQISFGKFPTILGEIRNKKIKKAFRKGKKDIINKIEELYKFPKIVDWVSGAALLIKKSIFEKVGGFDERFFLYYEDSDLCKRINKTGIDNYFFPYSKIIHFEAENIRENFTEIYIHAKKSQLLYYKLHNGIYQTVILKFYLILKFGLKYLLSFNKNYFKLLLITIGKNK